MASPIRVRFVCSEDWTCFTRTDGVSICEHNTIRNTCRKCFTHPHNFCQLCTMVDVRGGPYHPHCANCYYHMNPSSLRPRHYMAKENYFFVRFNPDWYAGHSCFTPNDKGLHPVPGSRQVLDRFNHHLTRIPNKEIIVERLFYS
jgi:hypothetical protein